MLLSITLEMPDARNLGYLLHKHPDRVHEKELSFGNAYVFFPEANDCRCTAALLVEVDPVAMVRTRRGPSGESGLLDQYVNDRPYVASSFLSVAIAELFSTAMGGRSKNVQHLADQALPLSIHLPVVPCSHGIDFFQALFHPLGYEIMADALVLDEQFPEWGASNYFRLSLNCVSRLAHVLTHLYVLLPVLDNSKHYWVNEDEVEKLLAKGSSWLASHPERTLITNRYLRYQKRLTSAALQRLLDEEQSEEMPGEKQAVQEAQEEAIEKPLRLHDERLQWVTGQLIRSGARRVLDLGCGSGKLLARLVSEKQFEEIVGVDVSPAVLNHASLRLHLDQARPLTKDRVRLLQGALTYCDQRLAGFDAAAVVEVIEHLEPGRLDAFRHALFGYAKPKTVIITTPNAEYNVRFEMLPAGNMRHGDHRFEWTRKEFQAWCLATAEQYSYRVEFEDLGPSDDLLGAPTQAGVFTQ